MRATVDIDESLLAAARQRAVSDGRTLSDVIDDALRVLLVNPRPAGRIVDVPTYGGSGLRPGVDLKDKEASAPRQDFGT